MSSLLMTGFPGFLGSALLPRILARREGVDAVCLVQPHYVADGDRAHRRDRGRAPAHQGPDHPGRGRHHRPRASASTTSTAPGSSRVDRGLAPGRRVRPGGPRGGRPPGQRRGHRPRHRVLPVAPGVHPPAVREHLLRQRRLRRGVPRGRARPRAGLPQPLRVDEVRGRGAGAPGDEGRAARHHLPARRRRRRLAAPARPRSTTAPTSCAGFMQQAAVRGLRARASATPTRSGSASCPATT